MMKPTIGSNVVHYIFGKGIVIGRGWQQDEVEVLFDFQTDGIRSRFVKVGSLKFRF